MAFRMKYWLGAVALGLVVISVWRLPLQSVAPGRSPILPEEVRSRALDKELRDTRATLDRIRRAQVLPDLAVSTATDRVSLVVPENQELNPGNTDRLRDMVKAEVLGLAARDPEMVVGYAYDGGDGGVTGLAVSQGLRLETYVGESQGTPYCLLVVVSRPGWVGGMIAQELEGRGWSRRTGSLLGPCAFFSEYGLPGPAIYEWLGSGGADFAFGRRGVRDLSPLYYAVQRRNVMGIRAFGLDASLESEYCLSGDPEACAAIVLNPDLADRGGAERRRLTRRSPAFTVGPVGSVLFGGFEHQFLLSDLEREFGPEAFGRFWASEGDVRSAFETAFGVDLGEWMVRWVDVGVGIERARPAPTLSATFGSLLLISVMTGLATYVQRRRRVV